MVLLLDFIRFSLCSEGRSEEIVRGQEPSLHTAMKLENQVTSLELSKKLKELGVKQGHHLWYWWQDGSADEKTGKFRWVLKQGGLFDDKCYAALTVAELGEISPCHVYTKKSPKDCCDYGNIEKGFAAENENAKDGERKYEHADTEANARAKALIYLLETKILTKNGERD